MGGGREGEMWYRHVAETSMDSWTVIWVQGVQGCGCYWWGAGPSLQACQEAM